MRNPQLICRYALILSVLSVLSFAASDWTRGHLGVSVDLPVATTAHADHWHGGYWDNFWRNFWRDLAERLNNGDGLGDTPSPVPEPSTTILFGIGVTGALLVRRRSRSGTGD